MSNYKSVLDKFKTDIKKLQKTCKHVAWSEWIPFFKEGERYKELRYCRNCRIHEERD
jgi:hypothetical protein